MSPQRAPPPLPQWEPCAGDLAGSQLWPGIWAARRRTISSNLHL